jgi:tripartite-type tricarboxylate transporter receptor subunit TctC
LKPRFLPAAMLAAAGIALCGVALAQSFPTRPVRMVVPTSAGSGPDILDRLLGKGLSDRWVQPVVVENKPGASGTIGIDLVAKSEGDGYMMVLVANNYATVPSLYKLPYDPLRDLAPVCQVALGGMVLVVNPAIPAHTVAEFVALAKKEPGKMSYGSAGPGSTHHMMMELFKQVAGIDIVHVPYKGPNSMYPDLLNNRIATAFIASNAAVTYVPDGKFRALAVAGNKRLDSFPDVPTVAEAGYKAFDPELWYGVFAQGTTAKDVVRKIARDAQAVLISAEVKASLEKLGLESAPLPPEPFAAMVRADIARYARLVRETGIKGQP